MQAKQVLPLLGLGLLVASVVGCEDEPVEDPIPIPAATASAPVEVTPEVDAGDGGAGGAGGAGGGGGEPVAKKKGPWDPLRISRCCNAIASNRDGAPLTQRGAYDIALVACNQARKNPAAIHRVRMLVPGIPSCQ